jgi:beta-galactosidase
MIKENFNNDWICYQTGKKETGFPVSFPHDAMLMDPKKDDSVSGVNNGWIDTQDYTYEKHFTAQSEWKNQKNILYFEGVYHKASVFLNGKKVAFHDYGYTGFFVDVTEELLYGKENEITVEAINSDQPNSRWYSGTGVYRPVWLYHLPQKHILLQGIKVTILDSEQPRISVQVETSAPGSVKIEIVDPADDKILAAATAESTGCSKQEFSLPKAECWSPEHPKLYLCRVTFGEDVQEERFGIRTISLDTKKGLLLNGKRIILRGACIHHDNGALGACAYDHAERRKVRLLKENGYNAIRSAHNPCSEAMLRACDELGMLMMDEYVDVWYIHKTKNDYATEVESHYQEDLKMIVDKDYNHPSVILYSTGNEVSETAQKRGIALCGKLTERLHELDPSRPVTCGVNIFFNFLSSMGFGVYSDKKAEQEVKNVKKKKAVGSEFFNILAGLMGADFMKFGATLYPCDVKTRDAYAAMDVAGYNYGIKRYAHDLKKYPNRYILGSETFCSDAYLFWEMAKKNPRIIGDFVWAGMDYLGEVGIGSWEYKEYAPDFSHGKGWVSAGSGRIDLTGKPLSEMTYTRVAFEQQKIGMGVIPVAFASEKHSPSAWKMTNAMESWSWHGCQGKKTQVEVYARADHISLYLNDTCIGTKSPSKDCRVVFPVTYEDGVLRAVAYDGKGETLAETSLQTAGEETKLTLIPEQECVKRTDELCYVRLAYTDEKGTVKPMIRGKINVSVEGGTLLGLGSACPYYTGSYLDSTCDTYYGEALAVIRPGEADSIKIRAASTFGDGILEVKVIN